MVAEMVIASTFSMSLMSMTEIHLCVPFSKNNNLGKKKKKTKKRYYGIISDTTLLGAGGKGML